jgi:hypothetical protein
VLIVSQEGATLLEEEAKEITLVKLHIYMP